MNSNSRTIEITRFLLSFLSQNSIMSSSAFILRTLITKSSFYLLHSTIDYTRRWAILNSKLSSTLHLRSSLRNAHQRRQTKFSSSLMRYRQVWWIFVEFDEIWRDTFRQVWWDVVYQKWWDVVRINFDESLSSCLMSRFLQSIRHLEKIRIRQSNIDDEMIKHDHENEFTKIFLQEKNLKSHLSITFHISRQNATNQVISIFATSRIFREKTSLVFRKRQRLSRRKTAYNRHVLDEKKDKNSQDNKTFIFIYYRLLF
jgi:hypothetical protein